MQVASSWVGGAEVGGKEGSRSRICKPDVGLRCVVMRESTNVHANGWSESHGSCGTTHRVDPSQVVDVK